MHSGNEGVARRAEMHRTLARNFGLSVNCWHFVPKSLELNTRRRITTIEINWQRSNEFIVRTHNTRVVEALEKMRCVIVDTDLQRHCVLYMHNTPRVVSEGVDYYRENDSYYIFALSNPHDVDDLASVFAHHGDMKEFDVIKPARIYNLWAIVRSAFYFIILHIKVIKNRYKPGGEGMVEAMQEFERETKKRKTLSKL